MGPLGGAKLVASAVSKGAKATKVAVGAGSKVFQYTKSKGGKALEAAMKRLGELPIFLPTSVGLPGAVVKARFLFRSSAKSLEKAMFAEARLLGKNLVKLVTDETHHIGAEGADKATRARELLAKWGIDINHPANGVFLPANLKSPNPNGSIIHKTLGSNKVYYEKVQAFLEGATSQADALQRLRRIGETLKDGTFFHVHL